MEKQISELKELDENEIASMIYNTIDAFWGKFPNIWEYTTKGDIASEVAIDLYRPRKADGVPHIIHYYNTKGERSLASLISMLVYNNLMAEARDVHSTSVHNNDDRRNVRKPLSLETPISCDDDSITIGDTVEGNHNTAYDAEYNMLLESIPDRLVDNVYYKYDNGKMVQLTYRQLLNDIISGYSISQISDKLFKIKKSGEVCKFRHTGNLVKEMKDELKSFFRCEYQYTEESYEKGWSLL